MKTCSKCKVEKPETEFYRDRRAKGGLQSACKSCFYIKNRAWMRANRALTRAHDLASKARRRNTKRGYLVDKYKSMLNRISGRDKPRAHLYKGLGIMPREEFLDWALSDPAFSRLWDEWQRLGRQRKYAPSIDRIDTQRGYVKGNVQFLAVGEHSRKTNAWRDHGINPITTAV